MIEVVFLYSSNTVYSSTIALIFTQYSHNCGLSIQNYPSLASLLMGLQFRD
ncbi:hypothetical protein Patl1_34539 [Pistacia atlantica]|uniref:Uncharacterized protein n=1 Tax=Pistacia atlantica TaxID=434234 RepID=A0ACC0ZUM5_9ROSI|nr:hypothetical protein Patl1_34539 [Pistacia atlantica]